MDECDVRFTPYAKDQMVKRRMTGDDEALIAAVLKSEPLNGRIIVSSCSALRAFRYKIIDAGEALDVCYVYFPNADVQLYGRDIAIVVSVQDPDLPSGQWLEPESAVRILEMLAELTRFVFG